jgi:hypothetical protein
MVFKSSFEDFLYVLVGLVWVAFSIYKGSQKKKKAQRPEGEKSKSKSAIEEILGEFLGVKEDDVVYREEQIVNESEEFVFDETENSSSTPQNSPSEIFSHDKVAEEGNLFKEKPVYRSGLHDLRMGVAKVDKKQKVKRKKPRINIRKAVIYSEILKRPTY